MSQDEKEFQAEEIKHFIYAADPGTHDGFYGLLTMYWETDALNSQGQICRFYFDDEGVRWYSTALNTNDSLECLWASPEGNLWVGSSWGRVWTTADVAWDANAIAQIDWSQDDPHFKWKGCLSPTHPVHKISPEFGYNIADIWGTSDMDVYFCTFHGAIMHWNGQQFSFLLVDNETSLIRMHGTGPTDVWVVGRDGLALHSDGSGFRQVPLPDGLSKGEVLTGVCALSPEEVYICSTSGKIFRGSRHGLERVGDYPASFYGIVHWQNRLILAGGDAGPIELKGNVVSQLRDSFAATGVYVLGDRLGFVQPAQDVARVVVHEPLNPQRPWVGWGG